MRTSILLGILLCTVSAWGVQTMLDRRDRSAAQARRSAERSASLTALASELSRSPSAVRGTQHGRTLFALVNGEVRRLGLASNLDTMRPGETGRGGGRESLLELRLSGLPLRGALEFIRAAESLPGVRVSRIGLARSGAGLLDLDMALARPEAAK